MTKEKCQARRGHLGGRDGFCGVHTGILSLHCEGSVRTSDSVFFPFVVCGKCVKYQVYIAFDVLSCVCDAFQ